MTNFNADALGVYTDDFTFLLEPEAGIEYARATNDPIPVHLSGEFIPPVYAVVPVWEKVFEVVAGVVPEEHFFSVVHGEQDMIFSQPLRSGTTLRSRAVGESISVKDSGTTVVVKTESVDDATGQMVVEQYFTMFYRKVDGGQSIGTPHDSGVSAEDYDHIVNDENHVPRESVSAHMDDDQTQRYAQASGDFMPIHLDDDFARSVGLPGIIIHGLCTMAHASWAVITSVCEGDPARLTRLAVRFSRPLRPGDDIVTELYDVPHQDTADTCELFVRVLRPSDGQAILTHARADITAS